LRFNGLFVLFFGVCGSVAYGDGNGSGLLRNGTAEGFADGEGTTNTINSTATSKINQSTDSTKI